MPCPAVIRFSSPGWIICLLLRLSRCSTRPSNSQLTGLQADMRVGWHLHARADAHVVGPVMVQEAPRAHGPQHPLRQEPADFGAVADGGLACLEHVHGAVYPRKAVHVTASTRWLPGPDPGCSRPNACHCRSHTDT